MMAVFDRKMRKNIKNNTKNMKNIDKISMKMMNLMAVFKTFLLKNIVKCKKINSTLSDHKNSANRSFPTKNRLNLCLMLIILK